MKKVYAIAVVLALVAGLAVFYFASSMKQTDKSSEVKKKDAVVAVINLPANTVITVDMVEVKKLPVEAVNALTYTKLEDVIGTVTKYPISTAEQVMSTKVTSGGEDAARLAYSLKEGQRAITISVASTSGVAGNVYAGDYVDVMAMMMVPVVSRNAAGEQETTVVTASTFVLQKMKVLSVGMNTGSGQKTSRDYTMVTLAGTPDQILQLYYAYNSGYTATESRLVLVLRPPTEDDVLDTTYYRPKY
ncbi:MAG: Flp pilus assembly protein CpaB [Eubacteriales bacterium]